MVLAALGNESQETDDEYERAMAGAMLIYDAMLELTKLRIALTKG